MSYDLADDAWVEDALSVWFDDFGRKGWFAKDDARDAVLRDRFLPLHEALVQAPAASLTQDANRALAAVLVLDQFSRNMFRDDARAFAADPLAREIASAAIDAGLDKDMPPERRLFFYLPFEHSESLADQDRASTLIGSLGDPEWTRYAHLHRDIVRRFGRFPHRNTVLGRASTSDEAAFLETPGSSF